MNGGQEMTSNKGYCVAVDAILCSVEHQHSAYFFSFLSPFFCNVPCYSKTENLLYMTFVLGVDMLLGN
jgi:hypothetical protein